MNLATTFLAILVFAIVLFFAARIWGVEIHRRRPEEEYAPGRRLKVIRDVTPVECPWLDREIGAGTVLFEYLGPTYGLKAGEGLITVSFDGRVPFFELPLDTVVETA